MNLYTMADAYETAEFKRRKPMTARAKQAISRALKGKKRRGGRKQGPSLMGRTKAGKAVRALGAVAALGAAARYGGAPLQGIRHDAGRAAGAAKGAYEKVKAGAAGAYGNVKAGAAGAYGNVRDRFRKK
jgi:hypothetical protein